MPIEFSPNAEIDWTTDIIDPRLRALIEWLAVDRDLTVSTFKTGHPMGATSPAGRENAHFYGRAADVIVVNGLSLDGNETTEDWTSFGRALLEAPVAYMLAEVYGPTAWHEAVGAGRPLASDPFHDSIHTDHIHISYDK